MHDPKREHDPYSECAMAGFVGALAGCLLGALIWVSLFLAWSMA